MACPWVRGRVGLALGSWGWQAAGVQDSDGGSGLFPCWNGSSAPHHTIRGHKPRLVGGVRKVQRGDPRLSGPDHSGLGLRTRPRPELRILTPTTELHVAFLIGELGRKWLRVAHGRQSWCRACLKASAGVSWGWWGGAAERQAGPCPHEPGHGGWLQPGIGAQQGLGTGTERLVPTGPGMRI